MAGWARARLAGAFGLVAHSLSGRLFLLTLVYVMLGELVISVPLVAHYHRGLLQSHIDAAELAILPFTESEGQGLSQALRGELLQRAGAALVILKRPDRRQLFPLNGIPSKVDGVIDLRNASLFSEVANAAGCLWQGGDRVLRVISNTQITGADTVEVVIGEKDIYYSLLFYAEEVLTVGLAVSSAAAALVFLSLYMVLVRPMRRITRAIVTFREDPEDPGRILVASKSHDEIGVAERELASMQHDLYGTLHQKTRLAALGSAVAKIQHDLRNILSSAQLASDRLTAIDDPVVNRLTPRLVASLDRAVKLATSALHFGRADEQPPRRSILLLAPVVAEAAEAAFGLRENIELRAVIDPTLKVDADPEQLYRILLNLLRNAAEALSSRASALIEISAKLEAGRVWIEIRDNGAGIPGATVKKLFRPFAATAREGGSGLGLAIARELARAHGGDVLLLETSAEGTAFRVEIPDREKAKPVSA